MKKSIIIEILIWFITLTIFFCLGIFVYSKIFIEPNVYTIQFSDIYGITKGSPVRFMGIIVGYVRKLEVKNRSINVQILITKKNMKIPNGTTARVEFYGLGASKSIELMPPEGSCDVGIITNSTIRIHDVVHNAKGIVSMIAIVKEMVSDIKPMRIDGIFKNINELKAQQIENANEEMNILKSEIDRKVKITKEKQQEVIIKIDKMNKSIEKINKFIKK